MRAIILARIGFARRRGPYAKRLDKIMPVDGKLLEILCCPATKVPVKLLPKSKLQLLNEQIAAGAVKHRDGRVVSQPLEEALITDSGTTVYRVEQNIPIMLEEEGIPTAQLQDFKFK